MWCLERRFNDQGEKSGQLVLSLSSPKHYVVKYVKETHPRSMITEIHNIGPGYYFKDNPSCIPVDQAISSLYISSFIDNLITHIHIYVVESIVADTLSMIPYATNNQYVEGPNDVQTSH